MTERIKAQSNKGSSGSSSQGQDQQKHQLLARKKASTSESISDALINKEADLFFVCARDGQVPLSGNHGLGLYYHDCRYLKGYEFELEGLKPRPLVATLTKSTVGVLELTCAAFNSEGQEKVDHSDIGIQLARLLNADDCLLEDQFTIYNYSLRKVAFSFTVNFRAEFEDIFAVRGHHGAHPGKLHDPRWNADVLEFRYEGTDGLFRSINVSFSPSPDETEGTSAHFRVNLEGRTNVQITVAIALKETSERRKTSPPPASRRKNAETVIDEHKRSVHEWHRQRTGFGSDNPLLNEVMHRSLSDLFLLRSRLDGCDFLAAGTPWFATLFGRDSILAALQTLAFDSKAAEDTLRLVANYQGKRVDDWRDEEPGKILHELRVGELARTNKTPHSPYYGSIDSTPLFLILLGRHAHWTGRLDLFRDLHRNVERALEWMSTYGNAQGNGYLAYQSTQREGLINQGWKDSGDAIINSDGSMGRPPISLVEVQGYMYAARMAAADLFERDGSADRAADLRKEATLLCQRFNRDFWLDGKRFYAMGLQRGEEPITVISSNPGQALWCGIIDPRRAELVVDRLMADDMFSGWGVRCLSSSERRYNPIGYHLGTVWPHDNSLIFSGFRQYGFNRAACRIFSGITDAAIHFRERRLPEVFSGFARKDLEVPVRYPVACHPQAWSAGAVPYMVQLMLGLEPDAFNKRLWVKNPIMPPLVDRIALTRIRVGDATVDVSFRRGNGRGAAVRVLKTTGPVEVMVEQELQPAGAW